MNRSYKCLKCGCSTYDSGEMRSTGGFWTKIFNIQNRKFFTISCSQCGYTEMYNKKGKRTLENILDFFVN